MCDIMQSQVAQPRVMHNSQVACDTSFSGKIFCSHSADATSERATVYYIFIQNGGGIPIFEPELALSLGLVFWKYVNFWNLDGSFYSSLKFNGEIFRRTHSTIYVHQKINISTRIPWITNVFLQGSCQHIILLSSNQGQCHYIGGTKQGSACEI